MSAYENCLALAEKLYEGQISRGGEPYIEHCKRVADWFDEENSKSIAILHDVIKDGRISFEDLMRETGLVIATGVASLTKHKCDSYETYIRNIHFWYIKIKLADITDDLCREPSERQKEKYRNAIRTLLSKI